MKSVVIIVAAASALAIGACSKSPSEKLAGRVENAADARADAMNKSANVLKAQAAALNNQATAVRDAGKSRADAIKAADANVGNMTQAQRDAIVANQAPAVR